MSSERRYTIAASALRLVASCLAATLARAQTGTVPVRPLGPIVAQAPDTFRYVSAIRQLRDGRVFVQDPIARRVLLYDATLTKFTVVIDSGGSTVRMYGHGVSAPLFAYPGDTTLFFDGSSQAFVVLDPRGRVMRTVAAPVPADAALIAGVMQQNGKARFDPQGRLIYRGATAGVSRPTLTSSGGVQGGRGGIPDTASSPIVRVAPGSTIPETVAVVRLPQRQGFRMMQSAKGYPYRIQITNPILVADDWVVTSDGSIALIRGQDYHIDWIGADGSRSSSPKLPFVWHRLSDSEKVAIVDSVKALNTANALRGILRGNCAVFGVATTNPCGDEPPDTVKVINDVIPADSLADYLPPFAPGSALADADGNVWLRPTPAKPLATTPGTVYDVVNRKGELIDRVQIPPSLNVVGFGPDVVYMTSREGAGVVLVRARIH